MAKHANLKQEVKFETQTIETRGRHAKQVVHRDATLNLNMIVDSQAVQ